MGNNRQFGSIRKLTSGRYQVRYRKLGRLVPGERTFATKADANVYLSQVEADMARGTFVDPTRAQVNFATYAQAWLDDRDLRPRTRDTYTSQLRYLLDEFGLASIGEITATDVRAWHGKLNRGTLHRNTVAKIYRLMRTIMTSAVDEGLVPANPVHIRGAAREVLIERPLLTWEEVGGLADAIEARFSALVWLAATSGLRFGELAGLTVGDLNFERASIRVDRALAFHRDNGPVMAAPKTASGHRQISVPTETMDVLSDHLNAFVPVDPHRLVFTSVKGCPLLNRYFAPYWRDARNRIGRPDVRFHDLRHFAGTEAASAGASLREVMARMGHASSDAALRYLKASERRDREIAEALTLRMTASRRSDAEDEDRKPC